MRKLFFDTETTGVKEDDKIIEICVIEMIDRKITGNKFHYQLNPGKTISDEASKIHGITNEMLADKPKFYEVADEFIRFVSDYEMIAHNAEFDLKMINAELVRMKHTVNDLRGICSIMCTKRMMQWVDNVDKYTRGYKLDDLKQRYDVQIERELHGALLDCQILAEVYLRITDEWYL